MSEPTPHPPRPVRPGPVAAGRMSDPYRVGIDPASPRCRPFYRELARLRLPLIAGLLVWFVADRMVLGIIIALIGLIAFGGLPPIIVTLAMLSIVRGSALLLGGPDLHAVRDQPAFSFIGTGRLAGVPVSVWLFGAVAAALGFAQRYTPLGLQVAAIGDNERAAWLSGHRTRLPTLGLYGLGQGETLQPGVASLPEADLKRYSSALNTLARSSMLVERAS